jgi:hypothetical protein
MMSFKGKYLVLPILVVLIGLLHVPEHTESDYTFGLSFEHFFSSSHSDKQSSFIRDVHHNHASNTDLELIEQTTTSYQKDLVDDSVFFIGELKNQTHLFLSLLSRHLSLLKPIVQGSCNTILYLVFMVFRL